MNQLQQLTLAAYTVQKLPLASITSADPFIRLYQLTRTSVTTAALVTTASSSICYFTSISDMTLVVKRAVILAMT
jgi:hypothetical protein